MSDPARYDFQPVPGGGTIPQKNFIFNIDLTDVVPVMDFKFRGKVFRTFTLGGGLSLSDNIITLEPFAAPFPVRSIEPLDYDLTLSFPDGANDVYIYGSVPIKRDFA